MTDESHQAITTMRAAFEFIEDLRDRIATLTAERDAAEKERDDTKTQASLKIGWRSEVDRLLTAAERVCEAAAGLRSEICGCIGDFVCPYCKLDDALTDWRRTKEGA